MANYLIVIHFDLKLVGCRRRGSGGSGQIAEFSSFYPQNWIWLLV